MVYLVIRFPKRAPGGLKEEVREHEESEGEPGLKQPSGGHGGHTGSRRDRRRKEGRKEEAPEPHAKRRRSKRRRIPDSSAEEGDERGPGDRTEGRAPAGPNKEEGMAQEGEGTAQEGEAPRGRFE